MNQTTKHSQATIRKIIAIMITSIVLFSLLPTNIILAENSKTSANLNDYSELLIDNHTNVKEPIYVNLKDGAYPTVKNPKFQWMTNMSPSFDKWATLYSMPGGSHHFVYDYEDTGRKWNFDIYHRDLNSLNLFGGISDSVNNPLPDSTIEKMKIDVSVGDENRMISTIDENALGLASWGATYHYTVTVNNTTNKDKFVALEVMNFENMIYGYKLKGQTQYTACYNKKAANSSDAYWSPTKIQIPNNSTMQFEIVTMLACGMGGTNNRLMIYDEE